MGRLNKTNKKRIEDSTKELGIFTYKEVLNNVLSKPMKGKSKPPSKDQVVSFLSVSKTCVPVETLPKDRATKYKYKKEEGDE